MALSRKIEISDFSAGLITDLDSAELPLSASSRLENADVGNKKLETQPGVLEVNTGLNASIRINAEVGANNTAVNCQFSVLLVTN